MHNKWAKLYQHPKWFKKRSIILKRDNYKCTVCGSDKNLRVHHTFYYKTYVPPWEYPNSSLLTVCEDCHADWHKHHEIEYRKNPKPNMEHGKSKRSPESFISLADKLAHRKKEKDRRKRSVKIDGKLYKL